MAKMVKKVFYLREDQTNQMNNYIFRSYKEGIRKFNESSLCRVAVDLLFSLNLDIPGFKSEEDLLESGKAMMVKKD
ncbi:MAG: hypothetical protein ACYDG6_14895 [Thermincolia bacterium]